MIYEVKVGIGRDGNPELVEAVKDLSPKLNAELKALISEGNDFIPALYQVFHSSRKEAFKESGVTVVCKESCSLCCNQTFLLTELEFLYLLKGYRELDRITENAVKKRIRESLKLYKGHYKKGNIANRMHQRNPAVALSDLVGSMMGQPCPFLDDNRCVVYTHRPLECRACFGLNIEKCGRSGGIIEVTAFDYWASDANKEVQTDSNGMVAMLPLPHWLWQFEDRL